MSSDVCMALLCLVGLVLAAKSVLRAERHRVVLSRERAPVRRELVAGHKATSTPVPDVWDSFLRERGGKRRAS